MSNDYLEALHKIATTKLILHTENNEGVKEDVDYYIFKSDDSHLAILLEAVNKAIKLDEIISDLKKLADIGEEQSDQAADIYIGVIKKLRAEVFKDSLANKIIN